MEECVYIYIYIYILWEGIQGLEGEREEEADSSGGLSSIPQVV